MKEFFQKLKEIFKDKTTHHWKNGWQHEGNIRSRSLIVQNRIEYNNLFLLEQKAENITISGPNRFKIEVDFSDQNRIRIDIEINEIISRDIFYYISTSNWISQESFLLKLCQNVYDVYVTLRESVSEIPVLYGEDNPEYFINLYRDEKLKLLCNE